MTNGDVGLTVMFSSEHLKDAENWLTEKNEPVICNHDLCTFVFSTFLN